MWHGNPVLTAVLFGLPLGFLTLICYSVCCSDIMDADDDEEEGNFLKYTFVCSVTDYSTKTLVQSDVRKREI
jgi:hypothetical protein